HDDANMRRQISKVNRVRQGRCAALACLVRWSQVAAIFFAASACSFFAARPKPPHLPEYPAEELKSPRAQISALRGFPSADFRQNLSMSLHDEKSGKGFEGRGAVIVRPSTALRMIVLGPGGTTAFDVWISE